MVRPERLYLPETHREQSKSIAFMVDIIVISLQNYVKLLNVEKTTRTKNDVYDYRLIS